MKNVLSSEEFKAEAELLISKTKGSLKVFSGFIKSGAIHWLKEHVNDSVEVTLVGRFSASDLIKEASDLEVYKICKEQGWKVGILNNLHSKVFIFDSEHLMLGSANLTMRGLSLQGYGNLELGTKLVPSDEDLKRIESMQEDVVWIDDDLYEAMQKEIDSFDIEENEQDTFSWSRDLINKLQPSDPHLWVKDLFHTDPGTFIHSIEKWTSDLEDLYGDSIAAGEEYNSANFAHKKPLENQDTIHDINLLNLSPTEILDVMPQGSIPGVRSVLISFSDPASESMAEFEKHEALLPNLFQQTKIFKWLLNLLIENQDHTHKNFGWVTSHLHNALMDDPAPSRGGVKFFVDNLFKWVEAFGGDLINTTHYDRTTGLDLVTNKEVMFRRNLQTFVKDKKNPRAEHNITRTDWIGSGKTYYQIKLDTNKRNQYLHRVGINNVSLDGHIGYDLEKGYIKKSSDSWVGGPYDKNDEFGCLAKMPDYSLFHDAVTGIPQRLYTFFELKYGGKEDIDCEILVDRFGEESVFKAQFVAEKKVDTNRYILRFDADFKKYLRESISDWDLIKPGKKIEDLSSDEDLIFFKKTNKQYRFKIDIYSEDEYDEFV